MSGDISPSETIAYPGVGSDNFRASDHPRTGLVGGQKGVKEVCAFIVDHDLVRSWSKLHRSRITVRWPQRDRQSEPREQVGCAALFRRLRLTRQILKSNSVYVSSIGKSEYDHNARKRDLASPYRGRTRRPLILALRKKIPELNSSDFQRAGPLRARSLICRIPWRWFSPS
jgi:hypothetical protein